MLPIKYHIRSGDSTRTFLAAFPNSQTLFALVPDSQYPQYFASFVAGELFHDGRGLENIEAMLPGLRRHLESIVA
jgi:hypothetical protein